MSQDLPRTIVSRPSPPPGYATPYRFRYPQFVLLFGSFALGLLSAGVYGFLLWTTQGAAPFDAVFGAGPYAVITPFVIAIFVTVVIHESIHGLVSVWYGYTITFGLLLTKGVFFVAAFEQYQSRDELFPILLAPLITITVVGMPGLFVPHPGVAMTAYFVLILNTAGSIGDLYAVWRLYQLPPSTLLYDLDPEEMYIYEPRG